MRGVIRRVLVVVFAAAAVIPATARPSFRLIEAMRTGDEGTVALELSLGAELAPAIAASPGAKPEIMALIAQHVRWFNAPSPAAAAAPAPRDPAALVAAVRRGDLRAMSLEIGLGADPCCVLSAVGEAVSPVTMEALVAAGRSFDGRIYDTPLMAAARCGGCSQVAALLATGANPLMRNPTTGLTAREIAARAGNEGVEAILLAFAEGWALTSSWS